METVKWQVAELAQGSVMDAREHFQNVVVPSYTGFVQSPNDFRLLSTALVHMNTVPEYLAFERAGYPTHFPRNERRRVAEAIRVERDLKRVETCANVLKHIRNDTKQGTLSSTGIDPNNTTTWKIGEHDLSQVAHDGFIKLSTIFRSSQ
jgi:hypothetical protein